MSFVKSYSSEAQVEFRASLQYGGEASFVTLGRVGNRGLLTWHDQHGSPLHSQSYGYKRLRIVFISAIEFGDGGLIVLGNIRGHDDRLIVLCVDHTGAVKWERYLHIPNGEGKYFIVPAKRSRVIKDRPRAQCIIVGTTKGESQRNNLFFLELGEDGGELAHSLYPCEGQLELRNVQFILESIIFLGGEKIASAKDDNEGISAVFGQYVGAGGNLSSQYFHPNSQGMDLEFFHIFAKQKEKETKVAFYGEINARDADRTQTNLFSISFGERNLGIRRFLISPEDGFRGTDLESSLGFIDKRLLAKIETADVTGVRAQDSLPNDTVFHHISTVDTRPLVTGALEESKGLILSVDGKLSSCKTGNLQPFKSHSLKLGGSSKIIKPRSIDIKILGLELTIKVVPLEVIDLCEVKDEIVDPPKEDLPSEEPFTIEDGALLQSPYLTLQAAGSDGSIATPGIMTRWIFGGELGDNHLPKGNESPSGAQFNRLDDFVKLYRFPAPENLAPVEIDLSNQSPSYVEDSQYLWAYDLGNQLVYVQFLNPVFYDAVRANNDPMTNSTAFLQGGNSNRLLIELRGALAYQVELKCTSALRYEALSTDGESVILDYKVCARGQTLANAPAGLSKINSANIAAMRVEMGSASLQGIRFYTYRNALNAAIEEDSIMPIGRYALSTSTTTALRRLMTQTPSLFDDYWDKFVGGAKVKAQNYKDRWNEPDAGLAHAVSEYITLSATDTKASKTLTETLPTNADPDWVPNQMEVSYLDMLRLVSLDYHNARMMGLGKVDVSVANSQDQYFYMTSYVTEDDLSMVHRGRKQHISMSQPTSTSQSRLPRAPQVTNMSYGLSVPTANGTPYDLTDSQGYTPDGEARYINHAIGHDIYHMPDGEFYNSAVQFDLNNEHLPIFFGMSYKLQGEINWQRPEITSDPEFFDYQGFEEILPTPFRDSQSDTAHTHKETSNGIHLYSPYAISLFSTASQNGAEVQTDFTELKVPNRLLPPANFHVQLIQEEDPFALILTTIAEQNILSNIPPNEDSTLIRAVFDYNHVQEGNYALTRAAQDDTNTYQNEPVFADYVELFFRDKPPQNVRGKTGAVIEQSTGVWIVPTGDYRAFSAGPDIYYRPELSASEKANYMGGALVVGTERFEITNVVLETQFPHYPIFTVSAPLERIADNTSGTNVMALQSPDAPQAGALFMAIENVAKASSWGGDNPLSAQVKISHTDWSVRSEQKTDDLGRTHVTQVRGFWDAAEVKAGSGAHRYEIEFSNFTLPIHEQDTLTPSQSLTLNGQFSVSWRKGTIRVPLANGGMRELKIDEIVHGSSPTVIKATDVGAISAPAGWEPPALGTNLEVNLYPGYKVYMRADTAKGLTEGNIIPLAGDGSRQTLMAARSVDPDMPKVGGGQIFVSDLCIPQILFAQEIRKAERPLTPAGLNYATPPDSEYKSTFELKLNFDKGPDNLREPYGVLVYRADIFALMNALYSKQAQQDIITRTFPPQNDEFMANRWGELIDLQIGDNLVVNAYRVDDERPSESLPIPDLFGTATGDDLVTKIVLAIDGVLKPLTSETILYDFVRDWENGHRPQKGPQVILGEAGQALMPSIDLPYSELKYNIAPMAYRHRNNTDAPDLTFVDFTLDGSKATDTVYFYFTREMGNKMDIGPRSPALGPVMLVNLTPPEAPQYRKVLARPEGSTLSSIPAIEIEVLKPPVSEEITGLRLYRTSSGVKAQSLRSMKKVKEVAIADLIEIDSLHLSVVDDFENEEGPLFGDPLFYRIVWTRLVPYEDQDGTPQIATAVSQPSRPVLSNIIDVTNRTASIPSICVQSKTSLTARVQLSLPKVAHNCTYSLCYLTQAGTWAKLAEVKSNDDIINFMPDQDFEIQTEFGEPRYHRFKVDVLNASGLVSLADNILTVDLAKVDSC